MVSNHCFGINSGYIQFHAKTARNWLQWATDDVESGYNNMDFILKGEITFKQLINKINNNNGSGINIEVARITRYNNGHQEVMVRFARLKINGTECLISSEIIPHSVYVFNDR